MPPNNIIKEKKYESHDPVDLAWSALYTETFCEFEEQKISEW